MEKKCVKNLLGFLLCILFLFLLTIKIAQAQNFPNISNDIFIAATVQPWLYFEVLPLNLNLLPDLVSPEGVFNIAESPEVTLKVGTSNPGGWQIKIKGQNNGLKSLSTNYIISSVRGSGVLAAGTEGYGAQATSTLMGVLINSIYNHYGTNTVGEIVNEYRLLAFKLSANILGEVAKMKIKAAASINTPSDIAYSDILILTIIPII